MEIDSTESKEWSDLMRRNSELEAALKSMMTFFGMDEQRGEVSGQIFDQARAALSHS